MGQDMQLPLKNIVFDLAGVVVARSPLRFPAHLERFFSFVFTTPEGGVPKFWEDYDRGVRSVDEVAEAVAEYRGCNIETAKANMLLAVEYQEEVAPTAELIRELKERGYRLIVLSNMSPEYIEFLRKKPVYQYFDEEIISCEVKLVKPEREIYELLLSRYGLNPAETIFIDDRKENVDAAAELGIRPFHFDRSNPEQACADLRREILTEK